MKEKPSDAAVRAWVRLTRAQQGAMETIEAGLKAAKLPPLVWYDVLLEVERAGADGLRPFELEGAMLLAQYQLSRLLARIETAGYIARRDCEEDGRGQVVTITETGKTLRRRMWVVYARAIETAVGRHFSDAEAAQLASLLEKMISPAPDPT